MLYAICEDKTDELLRRYDSCNFFILYSLPTLRTRSEKDKSEAVSYFHWALVTLFKQTNQPSVIWPIQRTAISKLLACCSEVGFYFACRTIFECRISDKTGNHSGAPGLHIWIWTLLTKPGCYQSRNMGRWNHPHQGGPSVPLPQ